MPMNKVFEYHLSSGEIEINSSAQIDSSFKHTKLNVISYSHDV